MRPSACLFSLLLALGSCSDHPGAADGTAPLPDRSIDLAGPDATRADAPAPIPGFWAVIPAGKFLMGSPPDEPCREPWQLRENQREVTLTRSFEIMTTEVTQSQFQAVMGYNPSVIVEWGLECPVETVTWHESVAYCNKLSASRSLTPCYEDAGSGKACSVTDDCNKPIETREACVLGKCVRYEIALAFQGGKISGCPGYRLPTEAEWEYAYRAGTTTAMYSGAFTPDKCDGCTENATADAIGWYCKNSPGTYPMNSTSPVGKKKPNAWGLQDMAGNVNEWTTTWIEKPTVDPGYDPITDPTGPEVGTNRLIRGGSAFSSAVNLRAANRDHSFPFEAGKNIGFRAVRTLSP